MIGISLENFDGENSTTIVEIASSRSSGTRNDERRVLGWSGVKLGNSPRGDLDKNAKLTAKEVERENLNQIFKRVIDSLWPRYISEPHKIERDY